MDLNPNRLFRFASPAVFYPLAGRLIPWFAAAAVILGLIGLYEGLIVAPADFQQGQTYRIIFIHVAASWMGMFIYFLMGVYAVLNLTLRTRLAALMIEALAPTGAMFTALALATGSFWGKPAWGTWWVNDARTLSTLLLLFLYVGYLALHSAIEDVQRADRAGALLVLIGSVNLPIIYYSVQWWNTLHQGSSINFTRQSSMTSVMLWAMLFVTLACWAYTIAVALTRVRSKILWREREARWMAEQGLPAGPGAR
jgi:heme exporter protein C